MNTCDYVPSGDAPCERKAVTAIYSKIDGHVCAVRCAEHASLREPSIYGNKPLPLCRHTQSKRRFA